LSYSLARDAEPAVKSIRDFGKEIHKMSEAEQHQWALFGARTRLEQIEAERSKILEAFPELAKSASPRSGRKLSPAAKVALSEGMRKYWAKRKAKQRKSA
jgi:hypothetical protein